MLIKLRHCSSSLCEHELIQLYNIFESVQALFTIHKSIFKEHTYFPGSLLVEYDLNVKIN